MTLTVNIPDDLAEELGAGFKNLGRAALEALAAEAYAKDVLSLEQAGGCWSWIPAGRHRLCSRGLALGPHNRRRRSLVMPAGRMNSDMLSSDRRQR
jgi:hypothetical protein